jgi:hypothetical protein
MGVGGISLPATFVGRRLLFNTSASNGCSAPPREPLRLGPCYLTINAAVVVIMVKTLIFKFPQIQALLRD